MLALVKRGRQAFIHHMFGWLLGRCICGKQTIAAPKPLPPARSIPMHCNGIGYAWRRFADTGIWTLALVFLALKFSQNSGGTF